MWLLVLIPDPLRFALLLTPFLDSCRHRWRMLWFQILALPISWDTPGSSIRSANTGKDTGLLHCVLLHWLADFRRGWTYNQKTFLLFRGVLKLYSAFLDKDRSLSLHFVPCDQRLGLWTSYLYKNVNIFHLLSRKTQISEIKKVLEPCYRQLTINRGEQVNTCCTIANSASCVTSVLIAAWFFLLFKPTSGAKVFNTVLKNKYIVTEKSCKCEASCPWSLSTQSALSPKLYFFFFFIISQILEQSDDFWIFGTDTANITLFF